MNSKRPPIVTVLGHVDHGKTTLLDTIRKTRVASREAGGITQGIGASKVTTKTGTITFIDTPGHKAFSAMRERGARVADIAILVVAADDGPMPQTLEALKYLQDSKTPMIVAFTKSDLPSANFERAQGAMETAGVYFEGRGGDTPYVQVSAKTGLGLDDLLEMINLVAEVNEIGSKDNENLDIVVIETNKENRGLVVSAVVRSGVVKVGDTVYCEDQEVKIRGLFDENGKSVREIHAGDPSLILGFAELPSVGSVISSTRLNNFSHKKDSNQVDIAKGELGFVLRVKSAGSIDAITASLPPRAKILLSGVGDVTESDVFFAKAGNAPIFVFESKLPPRVKSLAETEGVLIFDFDIIYKLLEKLEEVIDSMTAKYSGKLDILAKFPYNRLFVAGCKVTEGVLTKSDRMKLVRGEKELGDVRVKELRRGKAELSEAKAGEECGVLFVPQLDFEVGDKLLVIKK